MPYAGRGPGNLQEVIRAHKVLIRRLRAPLSGLNQVRLLLAGDGAATHGDLNYLIPRSLPEQREPFLSCFSSTGGHAAPRCRG